VILTGMANTEITPAIDPEVVRKYLKREQRFWGSKVHDARAARGFTLEELAALAGSTPQTIHKIERGQIAPRDHLRIALAFALGVDVDRLFPIPDRETIRREAS
jgi:transcriptional regulator with XRE-family HTH domain